MPNSSSHLELIGDEHLPANEGILIVPNRLSFQDLLLLEKRLEDRKIVYLT